MLKLKIGGCLAQGLSYEVAALVVVFINKGAPAEVGVWSSRTPLRWGGAVHARVGWSWLSKSNAVLCNYVSIDHLGIGTMGQ